MFCFSQIGKSKNSIMKNFRKYLTLIIVGILFSYFNGFAQRGGGHYGQGGRGYGNNNRVRVVGNNQYGNRVIVRSIYRPNNIFVFHPYWGLRRNFNRRWVYFPRYNFYWDNWRNAYVYRNGTVWVSNATPPPTIVNININNEKHYELKEKDDDVDDVYNTNETHQSEYKPE